jgi:hypothetical protein
MQTENAVHGKYLGWLDQSRMGNENGMKRAFELLLPEVQEPAQLREAGMEVIVLPYIGLQEPRMIRPPVQNSGCRKSIPLELTPEVLATHVVLHHGWTTDLTFLAFPMQAQNVNNMCIINALAAFAKLC